MVTKVWIELFDQTRTLTPTDQKVDGLVVHQCNQSDLWVFVGELLVPVQAGRAVSKEGMHYWTNPDNNPQ